jgi:cyclophilin family peptidyl-prolyl cis-trans isomerase
MLMEMPYSVNHFLQMVELKLWDGLSMIHGTDSDVILATPMTTEGHQWAGQRFVEANLTHMGFNEFSTTYPPPHEHKYSVSFSGRPGGPNFYISLEDDLEFHEHESTFGSVVEGRDVLDRFFVQKGENNNNRAQFMKIQSIEVI